MQTDQTLENLPQSFRHEHAQLINAGITTWIALKHLEGNELNNLTKGSLATVRNLKRLQGIAALVCELNLNPANAALLVHSGLATTAVLAAASPNDVVRQTGRLQRQLNSNQQSLVNLATASRWIQLAKNRQLQN
ncbi:MAG: DUF4332 domain-containing protein [Prochlorococcus sp.]|jgi:hypothetical protein|nr:DUF4332 domain-containing protein [Prochlorococcaceae cyanobacterium ETNP2_MAG_10]MDP6195815.1 DUF4332 domain-containing protein [Prochlorococcaceae cyanobacterium ETNP18_MAG_17]MDP6321305.1 DUF4332 domain-containing protein [Prochlorococcaceae cyanobacterium ETNP14_MAG_5]MDP6851058.1 DUF4332 domain-containing protein [Prochlorococcaceae cyanobacterium ETNP1_MAG_8]|tara:strand:+ start:1273 stop:1677 length:405 start_codon:yes stop_codon:yes gene_type:complete